MTQRPLQIGDKVEVIEGGYVGVILAIVPRAASCMYRVSLKNGLNTTYNKYELELLTPSWDNLIAGETVLVDETGLEVLVHEVGASGKTALISYSGAFGKAAMWFTIGELKTFGYTIKDAPPSDAHKFTIGDKEVEFTHTAVNKAMHLFISGTHDPELCPECIKPGTLIADTERIRIGEDS